MVRRNSLLKNSVVSIAGAKAAAHRPARAVEELALGGDILRCSTAVPIYRVSKKAEEYLRKRIESTRNLSAIA